MFRVIINIDEFFIHFPNTVILGECRGLYIVYIFLIRRIKVYSKWTIIFSIFKQVKVEKIKKTIKEIINILEIPIYDTSKYHNKEHKVKVDHEHSHIIKSVLRLRYCQTYFQNFSIDFYK